LENWNKTLEKHAERTVLKSKVGRHFGPISQNLQNTNAKLPGAKNMRIEENAATKVMMCEVMKGQVKNFSNPLEYKTAMEMLYSKPWKCLKKYLAGEAEWKKRVKDLKLGKGTHGTLAAHGTCSKGKRYLQSKSKGCRSKGAGGKDLFKPMKQRLKVWLERERSMCHPCSQNRLS
jgi:hypothetical protein